MRLLSSTISGVLKFAHTVTVDWGALPPGLIAITGPNAAGKTTLLESSLACLLREFPSRSHKGLLDYAHGTNAWIETVFALDGHGTYRARVSLDAAHRTSAAVLLHRDDQGHEHPLNPDGLLGSFDAAVATILPEKRVLLASVFAAQDKSGGFGNLDRKGRRQLFASLLALDHYQAMSERAGIATKACEREADRLTMRRDVLARDTSDAILEALTVRTTRLRDEHGTLHEQRDALQREIEAIETELGALQAEAHQHELAQARYNQLVIEVTTTDAKHQQATRQQDVAKFAHRAEVAALKDLTHTATTQILVKIADRTGPDREGREITLHRDATVTECTDKIAAYEGLIAQKAEILAAVAEADRLAGTLLALGADQDRETQQAADARRQERTQREAVTVLERADAVLARARADAALRHEVPCGGEGRFAACQFLTRATVAAAEIPSLEETVAAKASAEASLAVTTDILSTLASRERTRRDERVRLQDALSAQTTLAKRAEPLARAELAIATYDQRRTEAKETAQRHLLDIERRHQQRLRDLRDQHDQRVRDGDASVAASVQRHEARQAEIAAIAAGHAETLRTIRADVDALFLDLIETENAHSLAEALTALLAERRQVWDATTLSLATVQHQLEDCAIRHDDLTARRRELADVGEHLGQQQADQVEWGILAKALGRDGLQALEIDQSGPSVSQYANSLLAAFGSPFTIDLVTTEPLKGPAKDGALTREVFEIMCADNARGGAAVDLGSLSGGEGILCGEALRLGISVLMNRRLPAPMRTLFRDETGAALDQDNAIHYVGMLRAGMTLGGFERCLFITHNSDAAVLADTQIRLRDEPNAQPEIRFQPYGDVELEAVA